MATQVTAELERVLHHAFMDARLAHHRVITPEHVLLGLLERKSVVMQLAFNSVNAADLKRSLQNHVARTPAFPASAGDQDVLPTPEFHKLIQQAIQVAQKAGRDEVTVLDMFAALLELGLARGDIGGP